MRGTRSGAHWARDSEAGQRSGGWNVAMSKWISEAEDAEVDRIMRLSHAELVAEATARGEDPDEAVRWVNDVIQRAKRAAYEEQKMREYRRHGDGALPKEER